MTQRRSTEYAALFRAIPDAVVCADLDGRITQTNQAFDRLFGFMRDDVVGMSTQLLYKAGGRQDEPNPFRFRLTSRREATVLEYRKHSGETFLGETTSSWVCDKAGRTVGFLSIIRDISEEVRLRQAQIQAEQELQRSEHLLRETGRLARVGGWELDVSTRQVTWSAEIYRILGLEDDVVPTMELSLSFFDENGRDRMLIAAREAIESGTPYDLELPLIDAQGEQLWVRAIGKPHFIDGRVTRLTGVLQDITRSKQAEQAKREFISVVSHELRTPLTSIRGALGLLDGGLGGELSGRANELVSIASKNSERLGELINDILDIEKIEAGKISLNISSVDLGAEVRAIVRRNEAFAESHNVELRVRSDVDQAYVRTDASRFEQVLTNLLSNATKFSPAGGSVEVRVGRSPRRGFWRIHVSDHGPGVPEDFEGRLFEKFAQADASDARRVAGTGLGLSISKALTERMGGYIGYRTRFGKGTTFFVDFPSDVSHPGRPKEPVDDRLERVLVCEDDPGIARILELSMRLEAGRVDTADSAQEALEMLRESEYDAVTVDLRLPDRGGLALIQDIRREQGLEQLPVVLHVEDDRDVVEVTRHLIEDVAETVVASSREEACRLIRETDFDLVILDVALPDGSGLELLEALEAASKSSIPVVVFSVYPESMELAGQVAAQLVKSRVSNEDLRATVLRLLNA